MKNLVQGYSSQGYTFIEMMIVVAMIGILMGTGYPMVQGLITSNRVTAQVNQLVGLLNLARQYSVANNKVVTVCPSADGRICGKDWSMGQMLFTDANRNHVLDTDDQVIRILEAIPEEHTLTWRAFQRKSYLQFTPIGFTKYQNGTFRYCVDGDDLSFNRALIMSISGRVRMSQDSNGDGVHEDRNGKAVVCR